MLDKVSAAGLRAQISVKPTQLGLDLDKELCFRNLQRLVDRADERDNFIWIDMESSPYVDPTLDLFRRTRARSARIGYRDPGAYLRHRTRRRTSRRSMPLGSTIRLRSQGFAYARTRRDCLSEEVRRRRELLPPGFMPAAGRRRAEGGRTAAHRHARSARGLVRTRLRDLPSPTAACRIRRMQSAMLCRHPAPMQQRLARAGRPVPRG